MELGGFALGDELSGAELAGHDSATVSTLVTMKSWPDCDWLPALPDIELWPDWLPALPAMEL